MGGHVLIDYSCLKQVGKSVSGMFDQMLHVFDGKEPIGIQPTLDQVLESHLCIFQEEGTAIVVDLHAVGEGSGTEFEDALMLDPDSLHGVGAGLKVVVPGAVGFLVGNGFLLAHVTTIV